MSALPEHVSGVSPLEPKKALDGRRSLKQAFEDSVEEIGELEAYGLPDPESGELPSGEIYVLPVPPPPPKRETTWARRRAKVVVVVKADPGCWAMARELCDDLSRLTVEKDGSVIIHNSQAQARRWKNGRYTHGR